MSLLQPSVGDAQRPTPLNPLSHAKTDAQLREDEADPPELAADSIAALEASTCMCSKAPVRLPA